MKPTQAGAVAPIAVIVWLATAFATPVLAADASWHQESDSYYVYLGVIPAKLIKENPQLVDGDKQLHGGVGRQDGTSRHVMVSVFARPDNQRVLDATVIAKVAKRGVLAGDGVTKPLEKMVTSGKVTYGNFFDLGAKGEYEIEVSIYEADKSGNERVAFIYKIP